MAHVGHGFLGPPLARVVSPLPRVMMPLVSTGTLKVASNVMVRSFSQSREGRRSLWRRRRRRHARPALVARRRRRGRPGLEGVADRRCRRRARQHGGTGGSRDRRRIGGCVLARYLPGRRRRYRLGPTRRRRRDRLGPTRGGTR